MGLEHLAESLSFPSCGKQAEGLKQSLPSWSLGKETRAAAKKVFLSNDLKQDLLGLDSPGFEYEPKRSKTAPGWSFGNAKARPPVSKARYPEASNDLLYTSPGDCAVKVKYCAKTPSIGNCPRSSVSNAPDLDAFPLGGDSPGPMRYGGHYKPVFRHAWSPGCDTIPAKYTMRPRTKILSAESQTGERVGPGIYPVPAACAPQAKSTKKSLPTWSFGKAERFPTASGTAPGRLWDGTGEKKLTFSRAHSAPHFGFGTSTRDVRSKVAPLLTQADKGPSSETPSKKKHPKLSVRKEVLKFAGPEMR